MYRKHDSLLGGSLPVRRVQQYARFTRARPFSLPRLSLKRLLPYVGTGLVVWFLLQQIQLRDVWHLLQRASVTWVAVGFGWYVITNVFRAYRFGRLLSVAGWTRPLRFIPDMIALSFLNNALPARAGEFSFPLLMQRRHQVPIGESAALLLIVRLFDFLAVALLYILFALFGQKSLLPLTRQIVFGVAVFLGASLLLLASLPWLGRYGLRLARFLLGRFNLARHPLSRQCLAAGQRAVETAERVHATRVYLPVLFWSLLGWLSTFAWFAAFLRAFDLPFRYALVVIGATFATLAKALPFITVGFV